MLWWTMRGLEPRSWKRVDRGVVPTILTTPSGAQGETVYAVYCFVRYIWESSTSRASVEHVHQGDDVTIEGATVAGPGLPRIRPKALGLADSTEIGPKTGSLDAHRGP